MLAQPTAIVFQPDGSAAWVAAFNSDRVARLSNDGTVTARVDVRLPLPPGSGEENDSRFMGGPRGLAINGTGTRLYVLNKLSNITSAIDPATAAVLTEVPVGSYDPTPIPIKSGRGYLFDARLSGNGTNSCASCHLDADTDGPAGDLGDPNGSLITVIGINNSAHQTTPQNRVMHPMKGPMVTQTLRGLLPVQKLHWRGDRATLADFNPAFRDLMGGSLISQDDMDDLHAYLLTLKHHPNPNRNLDYTRPIALQGGNANTGRLLFLNVNVGHCVDCHFLPTGSDDNVDLREVTGSNQSVKTPPLRTTCQRANFPNTAGGSTVAGFGLLMDGTGPSHGLPTSHPYTLDQLQASQSADLAAFILSFDSGSAPITGYSRTVTGFPPPGSPAEADLNLLEARANTTEADLIVRGLVAGKPRQYVWNKATTRYLPDTSPGTPLTRAFLLAALQPGDALTFTGTPPGLGTARGRDRDKDGIPDGDEPVPLPGLWHFPVLTLTWESATPEWYPEASARPLQGPWEPFTAPPLPSSGTAWRLPVSEGPAVRFFRLRRTS